MHTDYCIGVVCPSNGTCVSNPTSYTCEPAHQQQSGQRSSVPGAVIGVIVAGLLVALLLCTVVVIVIIVCIILRKRRWPRKEILHTPTQPTRANLRTNTAPREDDVRLMQNPAYPVHTHIVHSLQRELEPLRQLEGDNSHNTHSSQTNNSTLQDPGSSTATGANGALGEDGTIELLSNPAYVTRNENHPRRREDPPGPTVSSSQGNTAVPHNKEYIQLLPDTVNNIAAERTLQHPLQPQEGEGSQSGPHPPTSPPAREPPENEAVYYI